MKFARAFFRILNKYIMVPIFRSGFGYFMGNPITGFIMVLKTIGRKTGRTRFAPVNYAIQDGYLYCLAGFGKKTHWFLNILSKPDIEVLLPGINVSGKAEVVTDPAVQLRLTKQILKNAGFAGFLEGYNPFRATDEQIRKTIKKSPVIRIQQIRIENGQADPHGWFWVNMTIITLIFILYILLK